MWKSEDTTKSNTLFSTVVVAFNFAFIAGEIDTSDLSFTRVSIVCVYGIDGQDHNNIGAAVDSYSITLNYQVYRRSQQRSK